MWNSAQRIQAPQKDEEFGSSLLPLAVRGDELLERCRRLSERLSETTRQLVKNISTRRPRGSE